MERERGGRAGRRALPGARHGAAGPARGDVPRGPGGTGPLIRPPAAATFPKGEGFGARQFRGALHNGRILNPPLRLRGEKLTATARAARSEAERAEREVQASASAVRLSAAVVMRVQSSFSAGVRRRDGGGIDVRRTDSHDPRNDKRAARMGRPFVKAVFSSTGRGAFSFAVTKENGGRIPAGTLRLPEAPAPKPIPAQRRSFSYFFKRFSTASSSRRLLGIRVCLESSAKGSTSSFARDETNFFRLTNTDSPIGRLHLVHIYVLYHNHFSLD